MTVETFLPEAVSFIIGVVLGGLGGAYIALRWVKRKAEKQVNDMFGDLP